jgi:hypothetical protein
LRLAALAWHLPQAHNSIVRVPPRRNFSKKFFSENWRCSHKIKKLIYGKKYHSIGLHDSAEKWAKVAENWAKFTENWAKFAKK